MILPLGWVAKEQGTLVFLRSGSSVLLIRKKRGHGAGKINAPGGRVEPDETIAACAAREVHEEVGVVCSELSPAAELRFHDRGNGFSMHGFVYRTSMFSGEPVETDEADPFWCEIGAIPFAEMWEDDAHWLPHVLEGRQVVGDFLFENDKLVDYRLEFVETLEFP